MEVYKYKYSIHFCILYTSNCFRRHYLLLESGIIKHARSHDPPVPYARAGCVCVCVRMGGAIPVLQKSSGSQ